MLLFLCAAAQGYSSRGGVQLEPISLILRARGRRARKLGQPLPAERSVDVSYPYFALCLIASSVHPPAENNRFFLGLCGLLGWALWPQRSKRFGFVAWA